METQITFEKFHKIDIRSGTILHAESAIGVKVPALRLEIDFGDLGIKHSSAQITDHYTCADLVGRQVLAVVNFPPKQIGKFVSEVLVLGGYDSENTVRLAKPSESISNGSQIK